VLQRLTRHLGGDVAEQFAPSLLLELCGEGVPLRSIASFGILRQKAGFECIQIQLP
jgi:hypothetical protein